MLVCPTCGATYPRTQEFCGLDGDALITSAHLPLVGRTVDRYRLLEAVGSGGMAMVYRALHVRLEQDFAFKALHGHMASDGSLTRRFHREAKVVSQLSHPNIVSVTDFGATERGLPYMVMEFLRGESLWSFSKRQGPLPPHFVAEVMIQVAEGLDHAHRKGFVHRDLKPQNVMLIPDEESVRVKILDFGLVGILDTHQGPGHTQLTSEGMFFGTPAYMSPEQITGGEVTGAADLYSLGIVAYLLLTGDVPFRGDVRELAHQHVTASPPRPPLDYGGLAPIVLRLLAKDPKRRFQRGREVALAIAETGLLQRKVPTSDTKAERLSSARSEGALHDHHDSEPALVLSEEVDGILPPLPRRARSSAGFVMGGLAVLAAGAMGYLWAQNSGLLPSQSEPLPAPTAGASPAAQPSGEALGLGMTRPRSVAPVPLAGSPPPAAPVERTPGNSTPPPRPEARTETAPDPSLSSGAEASGQEGSLEQVNPAFQQADQELTARLARLEVDWGLMLEVEQAAASQWAQWYRAPDSVSTEEIQPVLRKLLDAADRIARQRERVTTPSPTPSPRSTPPTEAKLPPDVPSEAPSLDPNEAPSGVEGSPEDPGETLPLDPELEERLDRSLEKLESETSTS